MFARRKTVFPPFEKERRSEEEEEMKMLKFCFSKEYNSLLLKEYFLFFLFSFE
jgi:hypothetical protein